MEIKEINTRGSEFFPMMEKVRGVRHKKKLAGAASAAATSMLGVVGALLILLCSFVPPRLQLGRGGQGSPPAPPPPPAVSAPATVSPSPTPSPTPSPSPSPEPSAEPSESPSPSPEPSTSPSPSPAPFRPYVPPADPTPTPTPTPSPTVKPQASFSGVFYESLNHAALSCTVTANEATDLSTSLVAVSSVGEPIGSSSFPGAGSFRLNTRVEDAVGITGGWSVNGSMNYALNGETAVTAISQTVTPSVVTATLDETSSSASLGGDNVMNVVKTFVFGYSGDEVHDYDLRVTGIDLGWMNKNGETYTTAGDIRTVWTESEGGDGDVSAVKDSAAKQITFTYDSTLQQSVYSPSSAAANATHFYLVFYLDGTGTDLNTDDYENPGDNVFALAKPRRLISSPIRIRDAAGPELSYQHLWYWGEFNAYPSDPGFRLLELQYALTPNDAANISLDATISAAGQSDTVSWSDITDTGTVPLRTYVDFPFLHSWDNLGDSWKVNFLLRYTLEGEEKTLPLEILPSQVALQGFGPEMTVSYSGGVTSIDIGSNPGDPFTYSASGIAGIYLDWFKVLGSDSWELLRSDQVYPGHGTLSPTGAASAYTYDYALPTEPPSGLAATHLRIRVESASPYTGTESGGNTETSHGPFVGYSDMIEIVPGVSYGDYLGAGTAVGIEESLPSEDGFLVIFPLDKTVVPDASDTTITPVSVMLTLPNGTQRNLLSAPGDIYVEYGVDDWTDPPRFRVRCEPAGSDPLPLGDYSLSVTLSYSSGSVTNLRSSNSAAFAVQAPAPDYGYSVMKPEAWSDPPGDSVPVYTVLNIYYDMYSGYTYSAAVTGLQLVWTIDGAVQSPITLAPPTLTDDGEGTFSTDEVTYSVAAPDHGDTWSYVLNFTVQVSGSDGTDPFSETSSVTSNEVVVKSPPEHSFSDSASLTSPFIGSGEFSANGQIMIAYNGDTGFEYTATVTAAEISFDGGGYETIPAGNWEITGSDYSDPGYIILNYRISGYPTSSAGGPCTVRFTVQISGVLGSDTYSTVLYPTASVESVPVGT